MLRFDTINAMAITRDDTVPTTEQMLKYPVSVCMTPPETRTSLKNLLLNASGVPATHPSHPALSSALDSLIRPQACGVVKELHGPMLSFKTNKEAWQSDLLRNLRVPDGDMRFKRVFSAHLDGFRGFSTMSVRKAATFSTGATTSTTFAYANKVAFGSLPYLLSDCLADGVAFEKLPFNTDSLTYEVGFTKNAPAPEIVMLMGTPNAARGLADLLRGDAKSKNSCSFIAALKQTPLWVNFTAWAERNDKIKKTIKKVEKVLANSGGSVMSAFYSEMIADLKSKHVFYAKKNSAGPKIKDFIMAVVALHSLVFFDATGAAMTKKTPYGRLMMSYERAAEDGKTKETFYAFADRELRTLTAPNSSPQMGQTYKLVKPGLAESLGRKTADEAWAALSIEEQNDLLLNFCE